MNQNTLGIIAFYEFSWKKKLEAKALWPYPSLSSFLKPAIPMHLSSLHSCCSDRDSSSIDNYHKTPSQGYIWGINETRMHKQQYKFQATNDYHSCHIFFLGSTTLVWWGFKMNRDSWVLDTSWECLELACQGSDGKLILLDVLTF